MIILDNYSKIKTFIELNGDQFVIRDEKEVNSPSQGVGGFSEDGDLFGIFVKDNKLFFIHKNETFKILPDDTVCTNKYVAKGIRCFLLETGGKLICEKRYKPDVDPEWLTSPWDPELTDFLLYLSGLLKDQDTMNRFIWATSN